MANNNQSFEEVCHKVAAMTLDKEVVRSVDTYGLAISNVSWEDSARTKNSAWGPCISDVTLQVGPYKMPIIRNPNFSDLSWDVPIEKIPLIVGNELGNTLYAVSLKEYLQNFRTYLHSPSDWRGSNKSLLAQRDSHVLMSSQACFLPVPRGAEVEFHVSLFNYQSRKSNPAVLVIVASSKGTSAQIVDSGDNQNGQKLFFNKNGERCPFIAQRLSDNRTEKGETNYGQPMNQMEKQDNMIAIIQVPLRVNIQKTFFQDENVAQNKMFSASNVEDAIVKVGESQGKFTEIGGLEIERDPNFPVRVTLQFYKTTDNGVINIEDLKQVALSLEQSRKNADSIGSLVVGKLNTNRPTEHHTFTVPPWWNNFWLINKSRFPEYTEDQAKRKLFEDGRFDNSTMSEAENRILSILGGGSHQGGAPGWNI